MSGTPITDVLKIVITSRAGELTLNLDGDTVTVERERVTPDYQNNTLWTDKSGHLWLVQYEPVADEDDDTIHFYSSLGDCCRYDAERYYGPFTRCVVQVQDAA